MEKIVLKVKHMTVFPVVQIRSRLHMKKKCYSYNRNKVMGLIPRKAYAQLVRNLSCFWRFFLLEQCLLTCLNVFM